MLITTYIVIQDMSQSDICDDCGHKRMAHRIDGCLVQGLGAKFCKCMDFAPKEIGCKNCGHATYFHYENFCVENIEDDVSCKCTRFEK